MKKLLLTAILAIGSISAHANEIEVSEPILWTSLYQANHSLCHKMILTRPVASTNDDLMSSFMMAYLYYKEGNLEQMARVFEGVDRYVEHTYFQGE